VIDVQSLRFARLKFDFDRERAMKEIVPLLPLMDWAKSAPYFKSVVLPFTVASAEEERAYAGSNYFSWKTIGLTHIPGVETSKLGRSSSRNRNVIAQWQWREDIVVPYLKELVAALPFESIQSIRVIALFPGHVGGVHHDDTLGMFYNAGARSVTLNISDGGQRLEFMQHGQHYTLSNYPAFIFRDDCYHGVRKVDSLRAQLRINGLFAPGMADLVDQKASLAV